MRPSSGESLMYVDPRGPRFGAAVTTLVLALVLLSGSGWLLAAQAAVFALGAFAGLQYSPYGLMFSRFVRPRLARSEEHTSELQSHHDLVCRLLLEKKKDK